MTQKKLAAKLQSEALAVDPNIFQYDEVYDEIENKRKEEKLAKKSTEAKAPKYIKKLLETAEKRKLENERRVEREVQKEREAEGEEFKDKESFVTSSYRKKIEEMKAAEEAEKREAYLESIGDVTKQQDMSGFYRHIYEQKMEGGKSKDSEKPEEIKKEVENPEVADVSVKLEEIEKPSEKKKNYRKRKSSADEKQEENEKDEKSENLEKAHLPCNLDADSDFSIDSSDSDDEKDKKKPEEIKKEDETAEPVKEVDENGKVEKPEAKIEDIPVPPKPKIDIWKKRTVGTVFDEAVLRYYQRKAEREAAA